MLRALLITLYANVQEYEGHQHHIQHTFATRVVVFVLVRAFFRGGVCAGESLFGVRRCPKESGRRRSRGRGGGGDVVVVDVVGDDVENEVGATTTDTSLADSGIELVVTQAHVSRSTAGGALDSTRTNNDNVVNVNATLFPDDGSEMPPSRAISFD